MKTCSRCLIGRLESDFYQGCSKCKTCTCADVRANRLAKRDHYRAYDVARAKLPHRRENAKRVLANWRINNPIKARRYRLENPEKYRAQTAVGNAIRDGRLSRPSTCQRCATAARRIEGHHADYSKPLDVEWLCHRCHMTADQERRAA